MVLVAQAAAGIRPSAASSALAATLTAGLLVAGPLPAPAHGAQPVVDARDARGDVRIYHRVSGVPQAERRGIDIRRATVTKVGNRFRFEVRVKRLWLRRPYDQMAFVHLTQVDGPWTSEVAMSPQQPSRAYAVRYDQESFEYVNCDGVRTKSRAAQARFWVVVPKRCVPAGPVRIKVITLTGTFRGDGWPWSRDNLAVPGRHTLR